MGALHRNIRNLYPMASRARAAGFGTTRHAVRKSAEVVAVKILAIIVFWAPIGILSIGTPYIASLVSKKLGWMFLFSDGVSLFFGGLIVGLMFGLKGLFWIEEKTRKGAK